MICLIRIADRAIALFPLGTLIKLTSFPLPYRAGEYLHLSLELISKGQDSTSNKYEIHRAYCK